MKLLYAVIIFVLAINMYPSEYGYKWCKLNPFWWIGNVVDPVIGHTHDEFWTGKPLWFRKIMWGIRNPLQNFNNFVVGFRDKQDMVSQGTLWPLDGHKVKMQPPLLSYRGRFIEFHFGWNPGGKFSMAIRKSGARAY